MRRLHVLRYIYPLLAGTDHRICHNVQLEISSAESLMGLRPGAFTHSSSTSILDNETSWWRRILFLASHKLLRYSLTFQQTDVWWLQLLNTTHSNTNLHSSNTYRVVTRPAWSCHCNINTVSVIGHGMSDELGGSELCCGVQSHNCLLLKVINSYCPHSLTKHTFSRGKCYEHIMTDVFHLVQLVYVCLCIVFELCIDKPRLTQQLPQIGWK